MYAACLPQILVRTAEYRLHFAQGCCNAVVAVPGETEPGPRTENTPILALA